MLNKITTVFFILLSVMAFDSLGEIEKNALSGDTVTLHDEAVDGDLGVRLNPTPLIFLNESNRVTGSVGGSGALMDDCFVFTMSPFMRIDTLVVEDYVQSGMSTSTTFHFYTGIPSDPDAFGDVYQNLINEGRVGQDVMFNNGDMITDGQFTFCLLETVATQTYSLIFNTLNTDVIYKNGFE